MNSLCIYEKIHLKGLLFYPLKLGKLVSRGWSSKAIVEIH